MKVKEESEKVGLKLNTQKTKIMESGPITSWKIDGKTVDTILTLILYTKRFHNYKLPSLHGKQMGKQWKQCQTLFLGATKSLQMVTAAMKLKDAYSFEGKL